MSRLLPRPFEGANRLWLDCHPIAVNAVAAIERADPYWAPLPRPNNQQKPLYVPSSCAFHVQANRTSMHGETSLGPGASSHTSTARENPAGSRHHPAHPDTVNDMEIAAWPISTLVLVRTECDLLLLGGPSRSSRPEAPRTGGTELYLISMDSLFVWEAGGEARGEFDVDMYRRTAWRCVGCGKEVALMPQTCKY
ncbi:hypothetical protein OH76DRAFT_842754 [Lentinus brumalis]|uniref:Uncharacterized protein n=1 Tax=Lentinus brumalis TaxID=2498619 RepID=A0A371D1R6_9APHY|nr:hypothetical protein OH76DRAFT_842754 [Polyporus brumalis]